MLWGGGGGGLRKLNVVIKISKPWQPSIKFDFIIVTLEIHLSERFLFSCLFEKIIKFRSLSFCIRLSGFFIY